MVFKDSFQTLLLWDIPVSFGSLWIKGVISGFSFPSCKGIQMPFCVNGFSSFSPMSICAFIGEYFILSIFTKFFLFKNFSFKKGMDTEENFFLMTCRKLWTSETNNLC